MADSDGATIRTIAKVVGVIVCVFLIVVTISTVAPRFVPFTPYYPPIDPNPSRIVVTYEFQGNNTVSFPIGKSAVAFAKLLLNSSDSSVILGQPRAFWELITIVADGLDIRYETDKIILTIDVQNAEHLVKDVLAAVKETQR